MKRSELKAILKECILELYQEGKIFQGDTPSLPSHLAEQKVRMVGPNESPSGAVTPNDRLNEAIKATARMVSGGNSERASMYESLIADTAKTTLQKQLAANVGGGASPELLESAVLPEERAADEAQLNAFAAKNRWAELAFGSKGKISNGR